MKRMLVIACLLVSGGCASPGGPEEGGSVCDEARAHVYACTANVQGLLVDNCDEEQRRAAHQLLNTPCDVLSQPAAASKADFWGSGNPLCVFLVGASDTVIDGLCWFDYNCSGEDVCSDYACGPQNSQGGACGRNDHCAGDLVCGIDKACVPAAARGAACTAGTQCEDGHCIQGLCAPASGVSGACDMDDDFDCEPGLRCDNGACVRRSDSGGSCQDNFDCDTALTCVQGQCVEVPRVGDACDVGDNDCDFDSVCIGGVCKPDPGPGDACESEPAFMCGTGYTCWGGVCEAVHPAGGPCESLFDCEDGLFCRDGVCGS